MSDVSEAVIRVRVLLHEAEVDVTMGEEDAAKTNLEEIRKMLDRLAAGGPLVPGGEQDEAPEAERVCETCYHEDLLGQEEPCCNCTIMGDGEDDFWESKTPKLPTSIQIEDPEGETATLAAQPVSYKTCETCNYGSEIDGGPSDEDECNNCGDKKVNWETA